MDWHQYIACFFTGAFFANAVPHFVHGISGNKFPTPFSKPRGIGLSSPTVNVVWSLFNLVAGYLLFTNNPINSAHPIAMIVFFAGISAMALWAGIRFTKKHKE